MLSDLRGSAARRAVAMLMSGPIDRISADENAARIFKRETVPEGEDPHEFARKRIMQCIPSLLLKHEDDFITIVAACTGNLEDDVREDMTVDDVFNSLTDILRDKQLRSFFGSAQTMGTSSGSAQPNIVDG